MKMKRKASKSKASKKRRRQSRGGVVALDKIKAPIN